MALHSLLLLFLLLCAAVSGYYLPGVTTVEFPMGAPLRIKVNSITSTKTAIPYDYYSLHVCMPWARNPKPQVENFG